MRRALLLLQNSYGIVTLSYDSNGRTDVHIRQSRGKELSQDSPKKKAKPLEIILKMMSETPRDQYSILVRTANCQILRSRGCWLKRTSKRRLRRRPSLSCGSLGSAKDVCKVDRFFRSIKGINLFPAQLLKILATVEKAFTTTAAVFQMKLQVAKKKHKPCVWWHSRGPIAILERLIPIAFNENKFQISSEFPSINIQNVVYIAFGCDRNVESTTMLVQVLNREGGNGVAYSQPICQYEDGAEYYSNLAATVYSENYPTKKTRR